jgi:hypothetical protein
VRTLGRIVDGDHVMVMVRARGVSRPVHELVGLEIVAVAVDAVTAGALDPDAVHPAAWRLMAVDSAAVPLVVRGGENVRDPVMPVQAMVPEATAAVVVVVGAAAAPLVLVELDPEPELQLVARAATRPSATSNNGVRTLDTGWSPPVASARTPSARPGVRR